MDILYEYARMCNANSGNLCSLCPLFDPSDGSSCRTRITKSPGEAERLVREWAEAHPEQTYKSYFFERFPNARMDMDDDVPAACVSDVFGEEHGESVCIGVPCTECWNRLYKEDV